MSLFQTLTGASCSMLSIRIPSGKADEVLKRIQKTGLKRTWIEGSFIRSIDYTSETALTALIA
jgi:hypothetical protein